MSYSKPQTDRPVIVTTEKLHQVPRNVVVTGVLLVTIVGVSLLGWQYFNRADNAKNPNNANNASQQSYLNQSDLANRQSIEGDYNQAANTWITYASHATDRTQKSEAYVDAAAAYLSEHQYKEAYLLCKKAESVAGITYGEAQEAAAAAQGIGNKSEAIFYYQKAIQLIPQSLNGRETQKQIFELDIQELQG